MTMTEEPAAEEPAAKEIATAERPFVVDASVAVKWFLPEAYSASAGRVLASGRALLAPNLVYPEVGSVLWKRTRAGDITAEEAGAVLRALGGLGLRIYPAWPLVLSAYELAAQTGRSVYDSLYLALAVQESALMVTADERLVNALQDSPLAAFVLWLGDY